jgi:hypothetical protein
MSPRHGTNWRKDTPTPPPPRYTCPLCGATSWNPTDAAEGHCGRCGANRLAPGVYEVAGDLRLVVPELLAHNGYPATPANVDLVTAAALDAFGQLGIPTEVVEWW